MKHDIVAWCVMVIVLICIGIYYTLYSVPNDECDVVQYMRTPDGVVHAF